MKWFYAQDGQQKGPVTEAEMAGLAASGAVDEQTLVWRPGMSNWQPFGEVRRVDASLPPVAPAPGPEAGTTQPDQVVCAECGQFFPPDQTVQFGAARVCAACKPFHVQRLLEGAPTAAPGDLRYAGFWLRFAAKFIDWLALGVVVGIPAFIWMFSRMPMGPRPDAPPIEFLVVQIVIQILSVLGTVAYNTFLIGKYGATLGKLALGLRVVTAENLPPSYMRAFGRAWAEMLSQFTCYIGYILAAFDAERRTLHDHICNTRVVLK